jgi:uncharacterized membrane protein
MQDCRADVDRAAPARTIRTTEEDMPTDGVTGPVELAVIEFPGSQFNGEIVPALAELVDSGVVTILDLVLVTKELDGSITSIEINELGEDEQAAFDRLDGEVNGVLSDEDLAAAGDALADGSSAMVIVWENTWARRLVDAIRGSGGQLVAHDRLDADTVQAALADAASN